MLDKTPFYGESGGQAGDTGVIRTENAALEVTAAGKTPDGVILHVAKFISGDSIALGDKVCAQIDIERREATAATTPRLICFRQPSESTSAAMLSRRDSLSTARKCALTSPIFRRSRAMSSRQ